MTDTLNQLKILIEKNNYNKFMRKFRNSEINIDQHAFIRAIDITENTITALVDDKYLGVITLVTGINIYFAIMHQLNASLLILVCIKVIYIKKISNK